MSNPSKQNRAQPCSPAEARELAGDLSQLAGSGMPLAEGLLVLADDVPSARLRRVYRELGERLSAGTPLDKALDDLGDRVPEYLRGLARAGIASGHLGDVLAQCTAVQNRTAQLHRGVWHSLAYPTVLLGLLLFVFLLVKSLIVQPIAEILESFNVSSSLGRIANPPDFFKLWGVQLRFPSATQMLLAMPGFDWWGGLTLLGCLATIGLCLRYSTPRVRHRLAASLPLVGPIWRNGSWAGFAGLLAALLDEHVPLPRALELTGAGLHDRDLADTCQRMSAHISAGESLAACFERGRRMPASLGPLIDWGTRTSTLPEVLRAASEMFIARSEAQTGFVRMVLPSLMFLLILAGIGFLVMAMYVPMFTLIRHLTD